MMRPDRSVYFGWTRWIVTMSLFLRGGCDRLYFSILFPRQLMLARPMRDLYLPGGKSRNGKIFFRSFFVGDLLATRPVRVFDGLSRWILLSDLCFISPLRNTFSGVTYVFGAIFAVDCLGDEVP